MKRALLIFLSLILSMSCIGLSSKPKTTEPASATVANHVKYYSYIVRNTYPHSTTSYTQGLQYIDSELWESTGLEGQSRLMRVDLSSGGQEVLANLPDDEFGEGLTVWGDSIFMITWRSNKLYIFNRHSGEIIDTKTYKGEGWGLTTDGEKLYMSSGNSKITVRDPQSFKRLKDIEVTINNQSVEYLNELEWIDGKIWANVYTLDQIVIIDPSSGLVEGVIDLTGLLPAEDRDENTDVLNGIAYDKSGGRILVTGKNWNKIFEIEIIEK